MTNWTNWINWADYKKVNCSYCKGYNKEDFKEKTNVFVFKIEWKKEALLLCGDCFIKLIKKSLWQPKHEFEIKNWTLTLKE